MKLIIDIPEETYNLLKTSGVDWLGAEHILDAVSKGTPLPKGHGNIYDERDLEKLGKVYFQEEVITNDRNIELHLPKLIIDAKPIIEEDKEHEE